MLIYIEYNITSFIGKIGPSTSEDIMSKKGWLKRKMETHQSLDILSRTVVTLFLPFLWLAYKFEYGSKSWKFLEFIFAVWSWWAFYQNYPMFILILIGLIDLMLLIIVVDRLYRKYKKWRKKKKQSRKRS